MKENAPMIDAIAPQTASGPRGFALLKLLYGYYRDPLFTLADAARQYGDITLLKVGPYAVYQVAQPDHIKYILQDNNRNYRIGGAFDQTLPVTGRGIATSQGDQWLWARRMMQPLFVKGQIAAYAPLVTDATAAMLAGWAGKSRLNLYHELLALNHRILGRLLFNVDLAEHQATLKALAFAREYTNARINALVSIPAGWPTPRNRQFQRAVEHLDTFAYGLIRAARAQNREGNDLLSALLHLRDEKTGEGMTDTQLHDELMTLFFAAYEDPANALTWALGVLTHAPEMMARLRDEVDTVLGGRTPTYDDLAALPYTGAVVEETLRLYPPTWSLLRDVVEDDHIGGYAVTAGSSILINIHLAHRLPESWPNPETFQPERFLPENAAGRSRYAYLPFGGGPRQCIAAAFALMQMKLMLAMVVQHYSLEWASDYPMQPNATHSLRPAQDAAIRITVRR
jgi:cytochrome P450